MINYDADEFRNNHILASGSHRFSKVEQFQLMQCRPDKQEQRLLSAISTFVAPLERCHGATALEFEKENCVLAMRNDLSQKNWSG